LILNLLEADKRLSQDHCDQNVTKGVHSIPFELHTRGIGVQS